jgi:hypothetical protein
MRKQIRGYLVPRSRINSSISASRSNHHIRACARVGYRARRRGKQRGKACGLASGIGKLGAAGDSGMTIDRIADQRVAVWVIYADLMRAAVSTGIHQSGKKAEALFDMVVRGCFLPLQRPRPCAGGGWGGGRSGSRSCPTGLGRLTRQAGPRDVMSGEGL